MLSPYELCIPTPSKCKRQDYKTPERRSLLDIMLDGKTPSTEKHLKKAKRESPVKKRPRINFALGALDESKIDKDEYTSMTINKNQLGNIRMCKYCNMIFDKLRLLQDHTISGHFDAKLTSVLSQTNSRRFCPTCKKKFSTFVDLKFHYGIKHHCSEADMNGLLLWAELGYETLYFPKEEIKVLKT